MIALIFLLPVMLFAQDGDHFRELLKRRPAETALRESAARWEANERDPARHLLAVLEIARAFMDRDPGLSLDYCRKVHNAPQLWPVMLEAEVRLKDWPLAERYGEAVIEEIDAGRLFSRLADAAEEARIRRLYAAALEQSGKIAEALLQRAIADGDGEGAAVATREHARRVANLRAEVLASEIREPATTFRLPDLNGRDVALTDYREKPLVAVFWATWCAPCVEELRQLNGFFEKYPDRFVAISTDTERGAAARFAQKYGYHFPILAADQATEHAYTLAPTLEGPNVPQLYVFDGQGNVRFHVIGFENDGMIAKKVEWMVEAALK